MGYSVVETDFGDEETRSFGKRSEFVSVASLYEIRTLATISRDLENTENEEPENEKMLPTVFTEGNEKWLAIAVGDDISIFSTSFDLVHHFTQPFRGGTNICGIGWIASSHILAVVSFTLEVTFLCAKLKTVLTTITLPSTSFCKRAYVSSDVIEDICYLTVAREEGETFTVRIPKWSFLENASTETVAAACKVSFGNPQYTRTINELSLCNVVSVGDFIIAIPKSKSPLQLFQAQSNIVDSLGDTETAESFVRVRCYCNGRFVIGLTTEGLIIIVDLWTYTTVLEKDIKINSEEVFNDFIMVSKPGINLTLVTIAVIVEVGGYIEMQVRSLMNSEIMYRVGVSDFTTLLPVSDVSDRVILLVESFACTDIDTVKVREIVEAQPEMKLQRLISRNQLDEAEQFAIQFHLDVQKVHVARMNYLFSLATVTNSVQEFSLLMSCLDNVNDHNLVGEICYIGAITFESYERIISLLTYSKKRAITDPETIDRLSQVSYVLATYRLIKGPENARFDADSLWQYFVSGVQGEEQWHELFLHTLEDGLVKEARVLWNRHFASISPAFNRADNEERSEENLETFFRVLQTTLLKDIGIWRDAIAFLEFDFVPTCLSKVSKQISTLFVDFLLNLARSLESLDGENFPLNALHATSTFERIIQKQVAEVITATRQAELAYVGSLLRSDVSGAESRLKELDRYSSNLRAIYTLKTVYQCPLSYNTFVNLNSEQICHQILRQSVQNPNLVKENIKKYARRYMAENNLEQDETLYSYIEAVSLRTLGVISVSNAWHDQCLLVSETIANPSVRCKAVCMIAKAAHPPWNKRLSETVHSILKDQQVDLAMKKSLEAICRRAELGQIIMAYSTPLGMRDDILASNYNFIKFIRFMFAHDRYSIAQRYADAFKMVELYCRLYEHHSRVVSHVRINDMFADHLQRNESSDLTVLQFLEQFRTDKGNEVLNELVSHLIDTWKRKIDSAAVAWTEYAINQRIRLISVSQSVILRFMSNNSYYMELYERLCSIRKLQEDHNMYVTMEQLENKNWRKATLENFIIREERSLLSIFSFSKILGMSRDEASRLSIKLAVDSGNSMGALTIIRDALRSVPNASPALAEACVHGCEFVLWRLQESMGNVDSTSDHNVVEQSIDSIVILSRILRILEPVAIHSLGLLEAIARMFGYVDLFLQVVKQCTLEDTSTDTSSEKELTKNDELLNDQCRIYGVRRRVGVYQMRSEGPIFARMEAIAHISSVAQSAVGTEKLEDQVRIKLHVEQVAKWNDFFNFLSLSNQDLLEFQARVYADSLPCYEQTDDSNRPGYGLRSSVRNVCLRAMQAHPCDLWTPCTLLSSLSSSVIEEVILELRGIVANRKSPQTMINFLRTVQFSMILTQKSTHAKMLTDTFIKTLWAKRLGKLGLPPTLPRKPIEMAISEFAKHKLDPNIVSEYVDEFCGVNELPSHLLHYAIELVQLASSSNDQREVFALLEVAHQALKVNEVPVSGEKSFIAFRDILYTVSPYNYTVLSFIISHLNSVCDDENREFVTGCLSVLNFLIERRRQNSICKAEVAWFTTREKQMVNDKKDPNIESFGAHCRAFFENGTRPGLCSTSTTSFLEGGEENDLYERDMLGLAMPEEAKRRLPFHPFLYLSASDIERFLVPIIEKELGIFNVLYWQAILRSVPWLKSCSHFSRSRLLSVAIGTISAEVIAKGRDLSSNEVEAIEDLLVQTSSRNAVVNCVAICFKKLPLCETKIRLMEMGRNVAQHWLTVPDIEPPMEPSERMTIEDQVNRLSIAIERYNTELILKKNGLYNERTCDLIESPTELVYHLYSNSIDWTSENNRVKQMAVIEQLAKANCVKNLAQIQEDLVVTWLVANKVEETYAVDPNDTMGIADLDIGMNNLNEDEIFLSPFFDVDVDRIVYLLKLINMEKIMLDLISYLRRDASTVAGGFRTIVRAACVLLRAYTDEQLEKAHYNHLKICVDLDAVLYGRLLDLAHVDIPLDTFRRQEKSAIVRGLVSPGARWTPQLAFLVASLIVDYEIADRPVVEMVLNRLQAAQKREMFLTLLTYCRQEKKLHRVKDLAMLWARAVDWSLSRIEHVKDDLRDEFEHWFYFAISCPVEGGRAFDSIRSLLRERNYKVAADLIGIVGAFTQRCQPLDFSTVDPERELVFKWTTDVMRV